MNSTTSPATIEGYQTTIYDHIIKDNFIATLTIYKLCFYSKHNVICSKSFLENGRQD